MASRIKNQEEKSKMLFDFNMFIPIKKSISGTEEFLKKLDKYIQDIGEKNRGEFMRKFVIRKMKQISNIKNFSEMIEKAGIKEKIEEDFLKALEDWTLELGKRKFSKFAVEEVNKEMDKFYGN